MKRTKTLFIYLVLFIAMYLIVDILVYFATKDNYKDLNNYEIAFSIPKINITEYEATYSKGHIEGTITNNTDSLIDSMILKFDFYNKKGTYLGTKYHEVKYFNVGEKSKFDVNFWFEKVDNVKISVVEELPTNIDITEFKETMQKWLPFAGLAILIYSI